MNTVDERKLLLVLLYIMPIIDTINGITLEFFSVGQLYRGILFLYCFYLLYCNYKSTAFVLGSLFSLTCLVQFFVEISHGFESVVDTLKLFLPIVLMYAWLGLQKAGKLGNADVYRVFDVWAVVYPLTIFVPFLMGIGSAAYVGDAGYKGFYYATNEISFVISSLVMYLTYQVDRKIEIKYIVLVAINAICLLMMGTKTGYLVIAICLVLYVSKNSAAFVRKFGKKVFLAIPVCIAVVGVVFLLLRDQINAVWSRWVWMATEAYPNPLDFLSSGRTQRLGEGFEKFFSNPVYIMLGWGLGGTAAGFPSIEMDGFDLLFGTGILGTAMTVFLYFMFWKYNCTKKFWNISFLTIALAIAMWVGHVVFYGQSGMAFAMLLIFASMRDRTRWTTSF